MLFGFSAPSVLGAAFEDCFVGEGAEVLTSRALRGDVGGDILVIGAREDDGILRGEGVGNMCGLWRWMLWRDDAGLLWEGADILGEDLTKGGIDDSQVGRATEHARTILGEIEGTSEAAKMQRRESARIGIQEDRILFTCIH